MTSIYVSIGKRFRASSTNFFCASVGCSATSFRNASASFPSNVGGGFGSICMSSIIRIIGRLQAYKRTDMRRLSFESKHTYLRVCVSTLQLACSVELRLAEGGLTDAGFGQQAPTFLMGSVHLIRRSAWATVMILIPLNLLNLRRCLSPVTMKSALPSFAVPSTRSSGSLKTMTFDLI